MSVVERRRSPGSWGTAGVVAVAVLLATLPGLTAPPSESRERAPEASQPAPTPVEGGSLPATPILEGPPWPPPEQVEAGGKTPSRGPEPLDPADREVVRHLDFLLLLELLLSYDVLADDGEAEAEPAAPGSEP